MAEEVTELSEFQESLIEISNRHRLLAFEESPQAVFEGVGVPYEELIAFVEAEVSHNAPLLEGVPLAEALTLAFGNAFGIGAAWGREQAEKDKEPGE